MKLKPVIIFFFSGLFLIGCRSSEKGFLVFQTDFGLKDGAVSAMKGVALSVDPALKLFDLTHEIPPYNIWEAAYRLEQTYSYWPKGTVFVSVVDPGVGTNRHSIVAKTKSGHYIVSPDNGTLTLIAQSTGFESIREIDENLNRRSGSDKSYTFHGRDVYAYTAARLASGLILFDQVGPLYPLDSITKILFDPPVIMNDKSIHGTIPVLDIAYGNVWTDIPDSLIKKAGHQVGDSLEIQIFESNKLIHKRTYLLCNTFGAVQSGTGLAYFNSLMNLSFAINEGNFSDSFKIKSGPAWKIVVK